MPDYSGRRDVGNALINIGSTLGQIYENKLEASEKSGARARWYGQQSQIEGMVEKNLSSPEMILSEFDQMQEKAHKDVIGSTKTPGARNQIEAEFEINWASARNSIKDKTRQLIHAKSVADFKVNMATLTEAPPEGSIVSTDSIVKKMKDVVIETNEQFKLGNLTEAEQDYVEREAAKEIIGHYVQQQVFNEKDPEAYFKNINTNIQKELKEQGLEIENLFSTEDVDKLRSEYKSKMAFNQNQRNELTSKQVQAIHQLAIKNTSRDIVAKKIDESDALTPVQKTEAWNVYNKAMQVRAKTGEDLFGNRPTAKFAEIRQGVLDGTIKKESQIYEWTGKEDGYGQTQEAYLLRLLKGDESKAKAFEDSAAAKNLIALTKDIADPSETDEVEMSQFVNQRGLGLLEDWIDNNPNATDTDKKVQSLKIVRQLRQEDEDGTLEEALEKAAKPSLEMQFETVGRQLDKVERDIEEHVKKYGDPDAKKKKGTPRVTTDAEYDALPSGTVFIDPNGKKRTKP